MPEGHYDLGGQDVIVKEVKHACLLGLYGSILKMNEGLKNLIQFTGDTIEHLWRVTSLNQAITLGIDDIKVVLKSGKMQILLS